MAYYLYNGRKFVMKKVSLIFAFVLIFALSIPQVAFANMAAPKEADIGSSITFEIYSILVTRLINIITHCDNDD
jgi:hypothetical protein